MSGREDNAFSEMFLRLSEEADESGVSEELAGPWKVVETGEGFSLFEMWQDPAENSRDAPFGVFADRSTALKFAAALSATSREPWYRQSQMGEEGRFLILSSSGMVEGWTELFHARLLELAHMADFCARSPYALAAIVQAAGGATLRKAGEILLRESQPR